MLSTAGVCSAAEVSGRDHLLCRSLFAGFFFWRKNLLRAEAIVSQPFTNHTQASVEVVSVLLEVGLCKDDLPLE